MVSQHMVTSPDGMRFLPPGRPSEYSTYSVHTPLATHWRKATCEEVNCPQYLNGWGLRIEQVTARDVYTAEHSGRKFRRVQVGPGETWLVFEAGQPCFRASAHRKKIERPELFVLRRGDFRAPGDPVKLGASSWLDSFGENQENLSAAIERG